MIILYTNNLFYLKETLHVSRLKLPKTKYTITNYEEFIYKTIKKGKNIVRIILCLLLFNI